MSRRIARPYATALFEVLEGQGTAVLREAEGQLAAIAGAFTDDPQVLRVFEVPSVSSATKRQLLAEMGKVLGVRPEVQRLLAALMQHYRLRWVAEVAAAFSGLVDAQEGMVRGVLQTPVALTPEQRQQLERALSEVVGSRVELSTEARPELIAGFVVRIGSRVFDGSVRTQLAKFARGSVSAS